MSTLFTNHYIATVRDESQQITKQIVAARNSEAAILRLKAQNYRVISIESRKSPFWEALRKGKIELGSPASKRELATFSQNLALMVRVYCKFALAVSIPFTTPCVIDSSRMRTVVL